MELETIKNEARAVFSEFIDKSGIKKGKILVVGCSTSEVLGHNPGTFSSEEVAVAI